MRRPSLPRFTLPSRRHAGLACGAVSIGVVGALLLGPSPVDPGKAPEQEPPEGSIVGKRFEDVATAELTGVKGKTETPEFVPRQVVIGFERDASAAEKSAAIASVDGEVKERLPMPGVVLIRLDGRLGVEAAQRKIDTQAGVRYAEPNVIYRLADTTPSDPYYPYLWGMENIGQEVLGVRGSPDADIDAGAAWDVTKGSSSVVAAVVDTGIDFEHDDLAQQIWTNSADPKNGVDDDRNGYIDDTNGWDFINGDGRPDDDHYHGTHVAGTIAARTDDGKGVVGVAPNTTVMPVKVLSSSGSGSNTGVASGFNYAAKMGARVVNASLGCSGSSCFSQAMLDVIKANPNTLYVIAAGNSKADNETSPHYPCSYDADNIICVAASDSGDRLASFSNWGATRVDLAAPGVKILSDLPGIEGENRKVILSEDFEKPLPDNWTTTGTQGRWGVTDEKAYAGNGSLTDRPYENYRAGDAGRVYTPALDLTKETDCRWGMTGVWDPAKGDLAFNGHNGTVTNVAGSGWSRSMSGDIGGVFNERGISVYGGTASAFRMYLELNAGSQANGGRGVFADDFWLTCADNSPKPIPPSRYGYLNGTSMATPHVAGAVALLAAASPQMSALELKDRILSSVDPVSSLAGKMVTGGRLNVARALEPATPPDSPSAPSDTPPEGASGASNTPAASEPQPAETSLYGKDRYLPWLESETSTSDQQAASDEITRTYALENVPPSALLGQRTTTFGDHTMLNGQWGLDNGGQNSGTVDADIDAPEAWAVTRGSDQVTVALMSSGYPLDHPGLADNLAINPGESGGGKETNGLDDDRNGYIDDWRGLWTNSYSSGGSANPQKSQPVADNRGQGTMAASLIAGDPAQGGRIFGISPETRILPIKVVGADSFDIGRGPGMSDVDDVREAIRYAGKMKVDIAVLPVVGDFFGDFKDSVELISSFPRTLFVAPTEMYFAKGSIPACATGLENLVCVRSSTRTDRLIYPTKPFPGIDLAAPGYDMVATDQEWEYREAANFDGTELPGRITPDDSVDLAGIAPGEGMGGGNALAFSPERDLPRGASLQIDLTDIELPQNVRSCGTTVRFSRNASLDQTIGIRSWADPFYRKETSQRVTGRGRFTELTSFWDGLMESAGSAWHRKWSIYQSAPAESWTSRDLVDSFGYTCPERDPTGNAIAWSGTRQPEYAGLDAALVGGTASLVKAEHPGFTPSQIKQALLEGSDRVTALESMIPNGRRLNSAGALAAAAAIEPPPTQPQVRVTDAAEITNDPTPSIGLWSKGAERIECGFENNLSGVLAWSECSSPAEHTPATPLADGAYTFRVRATGQSGSSGSDSAVITIDTLSPTAPTRKFAPNTPTNLSSGYLYFNVSGERDATFECRIEGINDWTNCGRVDRLADYSETRYYLFADGRDGAVDPSDGDFTFRARQIDPAGNASPELTYPLTIDRVAPTAPVFSATPAEVIRTNAAAFAWNREVNSWATDIYLDGKKIGFMVGSPSGSRYTFRGLSDGPHVARFIVRDEANNYSDSVEYSFEVRTDPLVDAPVFDPTTPALTRSFPVIWFSGANGANYECSLDRGAFFACTPPWTRNTTTYPIFNDGLHSLRVRQVVPSGDIGPVSEFVWTVDSTHPSAPVLTSGPSGTITSKSASFTFTGEKDAAFQCRLDSTVWSDCVSGRSYDSLSEGLHTFELRQLDLAGNGSSIVTRRWTVDTTPPASPAISSGPSGPTSSRSASFGLAGESGASLQCQLDSGGWEACAPSKSYSSLQDGPHLFEVRQVDPAGNASAIASRTWTVDTTPPASPAISSGPVGLVDFRSASISFSGDAGEEFLCAIDGSAFARCASPAEYRDLSDGSHTFRLKSRDAAGNETPVVAHSWTIDSVAPSAPTISAAPSGAVATNAAEIVFSGESLATFTCALDESEFTDCSSPLNLAGLSEGPHIVRVRQRDSAGNESALARADWVVDTQSPDAPEMDSTPRANTGLNAAIFHFSGETNATFTCSLDGAEFDRCISPASFVGLADGEHRFEVRQTDAVGHFSPISAHRWTVDTTAEGAPGIASGPASLSPTDEAVFRFDGAADSTFSCSLDDEDFTDCSSPKTYSDLSDGPHTFSVRQTDGVGNTSQANSMEWTVDTQAPGGPSIVNGPSDPSSESSASFSFESEDGSRTFCSVDGGSYSECTSPFSTAALADGPHVVSVKSIDAAGNVSVESTHTWRVDTVAASAPSISSGPSGPTASKSASFVFAGEESASFQCRIDSGAWGSCAPGNSYSSLVEGPHIFEVKQSDQAGNVSTSSTRSWIVDTIAPRLSRVRWVRKTLPYSFSVSTTESGTGLSLIEFSGSRLRPSPTALPRTSYPFGGSAITLRLPSAPTFARVRDAAGNWSGWVAVTG